MRRLSNILVVSVFWSSVYSVSYLAFPEAGQPRDQMGSGVPFCEPSGWFHAYDRYSD